MLYKIRAEVPTWAVTWKFNLEVDRNKSRKYKGNETLADKARMTGAQ